MAESLGFLEAEPFFLAGLPRFLGFLSSSSCSDRDCFSSSSDSDEEEDEALSLFLRADRPTCEERGRLAARGVLLLPWIRLMINSATKQYIRLRCLVVLIPPPTASPSAIRDDWNFDRAVRSRTFLPFYTLLL